MLSSLRLHRLAVLCACLVGLLYGLPNVLFMLSLGDGYRGIPMLQTPNEDAYLARIQEILDGHGTLGSPYFFEYKDEPPITPPTGEFLYALPSLLLGLSAPTVLMLSKFVLPAILFFLVYLLVFRLTGDSGLPQKINAVACGLLVVLGYDLVDYRTVFSYLSGTGSPDSFLLWARPVNPILGAIFLFSFLLLVWALIQKTKRQPGAVISAGAFLALMVGSYFFSWGIAVSVLAALILFFLFRKEYVLSGTLALIVPAGALFASPYWYSMWQASKSPWYQASALRSGLFYTHYPLLNKFLLAALVVFLAALILEYVWKKKKGVAFRLEEWHFFCFALILGSLWAYSQQIVTGRTLWPYHFVQYTIPLSMVVCGVLLYNVIQEKSRYLWMGFIGVIIASSLYFGVYTQASAYRTAYPHYKEIQRYAPLLRWLNEQEKDCVVLQSDAEEGIGGMPIAIPAFTHCNLYNSATVSSLLPEERIWHNYLALLFMKGVTPETLIEYLKNHQPEERVYLSSNWKGVFGVKEFPDFRDAVLEERMAEVPERYQTFFKRDVAAELKKYRLDFIVSVGPLPAGVKERLSDAKLMKEFNDIFIYRL